MNSLKLGLGKRVRALRRTAKMTQEGLSEEAGITIGHVGAVERGDRWPGPDVLESIAKALGVTPRDLMPGTESGKTTELLDEAYAVLAALKKSDLERAVRLLKAM